MPAPGGGGGPAATSQQGDAGPIESLPKRQRRGSTARAAAKPQRPTDAMIMDMDTASGSGTLKNAVMRLCEQESVGEYSDALYQWVKRRRAFLQQEAAQQQQTGGGAPPAAGTPATAAATAAAATAAASDAARMPSPPAPAPAAAASGRNTADATAGADILVALSSSPVATPRAEQETQRLRLQNLQLTQQLAESQAKLAVTEDRVSRAETNSTNTPRPGGGGPRRQMAFASSGGGASGAKVQSVSPSGFKPPRQKAAGKPKGNAKKDMSGRQEEKIDGAEIDLGLALGAYRKVFKSNEFTKSPAFRSGVITGLGGKLADTLRKLF